jgi:hypothetical protein
VVCKKIQVSKYNKRKSRDFAEEYPKLRYAYFEVIKGGLFHFSHSKGGLIREKGLISEGAKRIQHPIIT